MNPLAWLRRLVGRTGEATSFILFILTTASVGAGLSAGSAGVQGLSLIALGLLIIAVFARLANAEGHTRLHRMAIKAKPVVPEQVRRYAAYLELSWPASDEEIKAAARRKMKASHPDLASGSNADLDRIKQIRDQLLQTPRSQPKPISGEAYLKEWRSTAGWHGQLWGALFPSETLLILQRATGASLWPRPFNKIGRA